MDLVWLPSFYQRGFSFVNCYCATVPLLHQKLINEFYLLEFIQCTFPMREHIHPARIALIRIEHKIGDDVLPGKCTFEKFAAKETPVAGEGEVPGFEFHKVDRDLC